MSKVVRCRGDFLSHEGKTILWDEPGDEHEEGRLILALHVATHHWLTKLRHEKQIKHIDLHRKEVAQRTAAQAKAREAERTKRIQEQLRSLIARRFRGVDVKITHAQTARIIQRAGLTEYAKLTETQLEYVLFCAAAEALQGDGQELEVISRIAHILGSIDSSA